MHSRYNGREVPVERTGSQKKQGAASVSLCAPTVPGRSGSSVRRFCSCDPPRPRRSTAECPKRTQPNTTALAWPGFSSPRCARCNQRPYLNQPFQSNSNLAIAPEHPPFHCRSTAQRAVSGPWRWRGAASWSPSLHLGEKRTGGRGEIIETVKGLRGREFALRREWCEEGGAGVHRYCAPFCPHRTTHTPGY